MTGDTSIWRSILTHGRHDEEYIFSIYKYVTILYNTIFVVFSWWCCIMISLYPVEGWYLENWNNKKKTKHKLMVRTWNLNSISVGEAYTAKCCLLHVQPLMKTKIKCWLGSIHVGDDYTAKMAAYHFHQWKYWNDFKYNNLKCFPYIFWGEQQRKTLINKNPYLDNLCKINIFFFW